MQTTTHICGVEHAKWLDNRVRRMLQNPRKLFGKYVKAGGVAFDVGCGPGAFTQALAEMVGPRGTVVAIDVQEEMLAMTRRKIAASGLEDRVAFHRCSAESLAMDQKADFIVTFYMVHESPAPMHLVDEVAAALEPGGCWYLAEPKMHVSEKACQEIIDRSIANGLKLVERKGVFSRIAVFQR